VWTITWRGDGDKEKGAVEGIWEENETHGIDFIDTQHTATHTVTHHHTLQQRKKMEPTTLISLN